MFTFEQIKQLLNSNHQSWNFQANIVHNFAQENGLTISELALALGKRPNYIETLVLLGEFGKKYPTLFQIKNRRVAKKLIRLYSNNSIKLRQEIQLEIVKDKLKYGKTNSTKNSITRNNHNSIEKLL